MPAVSETLQSRTAKVYYAFRDELRRHRCTTTLSRRRRIHGLRQASVNARDDETVERAGRALARKVATEGWTRLYVPQMPYGVSVQVFQSKQDGIALRGISDYVMTPRPMQLYRFDVVGV